MKKYQKKLALWYKIHKKGRERQVHWIRHKPSCGFVLLFSRGSSQCKFDNGTGIWFILPS